MSERYFICRESWITGRTARRLASAMRNFKLPEHEIPGCAGLGMLCKVGFAMFSDPGTNWTREEIDEISEPGFCDLLLKIGALKENGGLFSLDNISPDLCREMYNQVNSARMREVRRRKKEEQSSERSHSSHEFARDERENPRVCTSANYVRINNKIERENLNLGISTRASAQGRPIPEDAEEVFMFLKNQPHCGLSEEETRQCASTFFLQQDAIGWVGPRGAALRDWKKLALAFFGNWQQNNRSNFTATRARNKRPTLDPRETLPDAPF